MPARSHRDNGYKNYPPEVLATLKSIRNLKDLGFTLEEIREIIIRRQMRALDSHTTVRMIDQKIIHLDLQVDKLLLYKQRLEQARMQVLGEKVNHIVPLTEMRLCA